MDKNKIALFGILALLVVITIYSESARAQLPAGEKMIATLTSYNLGSMPIWTDGQAWIKVEGFVFPQNETVRVQTQEAYPFSFEVLLNYSKPSTLLPEIRSGTRAYVTELYGWNVVEIYDIPFTRTTY